MEPTPIGETMALVIRLRAAADGQWLLDVDGTSTLEALPLLPATFVVQLWRSNTTKVVRGTIQLHGSQHVASIQGNVQLLDLLREWLRLGPVAPRAEQTAES